MTMLAPYRSSPYNKTGEVEYEGDLASPETTYARAVDYTAIGSATEFDHSTLWTRSAVVNRFNRMNGLVYNYSYGSVEMHTRLPYPGEADGQIRVSSYQTLLTHLNDWTTNHAWFAAGYPRNLGWTFRTQQLQTNPSTGGPTPARMGAKPAFSRVQRVPRYSTVPATYATVSARS